MFYSYNSILNIDSMNIDTIYNKRHYHLPYVAYWLGQIATTAIGVNMTTIGLTFSAKAESSKSSSSSDVNCSRIFQVEHLWGLSVWSPALVEVSYSVTQCALSRCRPIIVLLLG